tara:strand:+ start:2563 stop:3576 length:1014 start_codon:yes stop_codon:yes gene_type:complete
MFILLSFLFAYSLGIIYYILWTKIFSGLPLNTYSNPLFSDNTEIKSIQVIHKHKITEEHILLTLKYDSLSEKIYTDSGVLPGEYIKIYVPIDNLENKDYIKEIPTNQYFPELNNNVLTIQRKYNIVNNCPENGTFDLLIKVYSDDSTGDTGKVSRYLNSLNPRNFKESNESQARIWASGPHGQFAYISPGKINAPAGDIITFSHISFLAAGTGITPIIPIIDAIVKDVNDYTKVSLIYANKNEKSILFKDYLDSLIHSSYNIDNIHYVIESNEPNDTLNEDFSIGRIDKNIIKKYIGFEKNFNKASQGIIFICGPHEFNIQCKSNLKQSGFHTSFYF